MVSGMAVPSHLYSMSDMTTEESLYTAFAAAVSSFWRSIDFTDIIHIPSTKTLDIGFFYYIVFIKIPGCLVIDHLPFICSGKTKGEQREYKGKHLPC